MPHGCLCLHVCASMRVSLFAHGSQPCVLASHHVVRSTVGPSSQTKTRSIIARTFSSSAVSQSATEQEELAALLPFVHTSGAPTRCLPSPSPSPSSLSLIFFLRPQWYEDQDIDRHADLSFKETPCGESHSINPPRSSMPLHGSIALPRLRCRRLKALLKVQASVLLPQVTPGI